MMQSVVARPLSLLLATALCLPTTTVLAAPAPGAPADPSTMTPEQKLEKAKQLFGEGNAALEAGDAVTALGKFEDAYNNYTPERHKFNFNIGVAAHLAGDCVKAKAAFQRFLDLVPEDPNRGEAQLKVLEIDRSGCANVAPTTTTPPTTTTSPVDDEDDAPILSSRRSEREDVIDRERTTADLKRTPPLVIAGAVLTGVGGLAVIGGAVSIGLANKKANDLAGLASPGPTGFPSGNYAEDDVFNLDRNELPANNVATVVLFTAGGAMLVTGIALLAVGLSKRKKEKKAAGMAANDRRPRLVGAGPSVLRGGAGAGATIKF